jgi:hypothetical protein
VFPKVRAYSVNTGHLQRSGRSLSVRFRLCRKVRVWHLLYKSDALIWRNEFENRLYTTETRCWRHSNDDHRGYRIKLVHEVVTL